MNVLTIKNNELWWGRGLSYRNEDSPTFKFLQGPQFASFKNNESLVLRRTMPPNPFLCTHRER